MRGKWMEELIEVLTGELVQEDVADGEKISFMVSEFENVKGDIAGARKLMEIATRSIEAVDRVLPMCSLMSVLLIRRAILIVMMLNQLFSMHRPMLLLWVGCRLRCTRR